MKVSCQRCNSNEVFEIPSFSSEEREILSKATQFSILEAIKEMRKMHKVNLKTSKFIATHINPKHRECYRCSSQINSLEYTTCTKCKALNTNWL